jgi:hypothetical protein
MVYAVEHHERLEETHSGKTTTHDSVITEHYPMSLESSRVSVALDLQPRLKGLLWYSTYMLNFQALYTFAPPPQAAPSTFRLALPVSDAVYDDISVKLGDSPLPFRVVDGAIEVPLTPTLDKPLVFSVGYRSRGLDNWAYQFGEQVSQVKDFDLQMTTNFSDIDFLQNTLSPTAKEQIGEGWKLEWKYTNLLSGYVIGMKMPEKLQPGYLAGQISLFAPVSLFFFFFIMMLLSTLKSIKLHPMHYFFLAAAFFAFHLLMAYLVDHISIHAAFVISSIVSMFLVFTYLRRVVGLRFAAVEAALAQLIYLVLFSYAFFFKGYTGLTLTIGSIMTLFVAMQATAKIDWEERFEKAL